MDAKITKITATSGGIVYGELVDEKPRHEAKFVNVDGSVSSLLVENFAFSAQSDPALVEGARIRVKGRVTVPFTRAGTFPLTPRVNVESFEA